MSRPAQPRSIVGFHQDDSGDWVADLACGHAQHVRHKPPWEMRPWVESEQGRQQRIGQILLCTKCSEGVPQKEPAATPERV